MALGRSARSKDIDIALLLALRGDAGPESRADLGPERVGKKGVMNNEEEDREGGKEEEEAEALDKAGGRALPFPVPQGLWAIHPIRYSRPRSVLIQALAVKYTGKEPLHMGLFCAIFLFTLA